MLPPAVLTAVSILATAALLPNAVSESLTDAQVSAVRSRLADGAKLSWELGTRSQAILELDAPGFSVFSKNSLPPSSSVPSNVASAISPVFSIAETIVSGRNSSNANATASGPQPLIKDGSAADPASIGVSVLLANWTRQEGQDYAGAATDQLDYLFQNVPKTTDGAISHRVSELQLWSDFVYMVPPFLAYYGVLSQNRTLLWEAYQQIHLYRNYLRDTSANNLWKHILLGQSGNDEGHWSTGNGWAAAGMVRVLATIQHSQYANSLKDEQSDLANWVKEIHLAMYPNMDWTSIFTNYADASLNASGRFYDAASTALLASTVYRIAILWNDHSHLAFAEKSRQALFASNSSSPLVHFTSDGWLTPVVNPHQFGVEGSESPEGQAFVLKMQAAWRDWVAGGSKGANSGVRVAVGMLWWMWIGVMVGAVMTSVC